MFVDSAPQLMEDMRTSLAASDAKTLERSAHTLKGCVCNFGQNAAYQGARNVEMLARAGNLLDSAEAFRRLEGAMQKLLAELNDLCAPATTQS
jgi:HPt (histidine-containing phosphotransfer) domain-containing protein